MIKRSLFLFLMFGVFAAACGDHLQETIPPPEKVILEPGQHILCGKSKDGKIEFEDGTQFKALPRDANTVYESWEYQDLISFSHNPYPYPIKDSEFYIENLDRGDFVHANFHAEPDLNEPYTLRIRHVDPYYGEIFLTNNAGIETEWHVYEKDYYLLETWDVGDRISIGKNDNFIENFGTGSPYILLNCDKSHTKHVRVYLP